MIGKHQTRLSTSESQDCPRRLCRTLQRQLRICQGSQTRDNQDSVQDQAERDARRAQAFFDAVEGQEFRNARSRIREQYADIEEQETEESRVIGEIVERAVRAKQLEQEQIEEEQYERNVRVLYRHFEELLLREAASQRYTIGNGSSMRMIRNAGMRRGFH